MSHWHHVGLVLLFGSANALAADRAAASCSRSDVMTAIAAAVDGDRVLVPAGTCTWAGNIKVTGKSISIIGAGIGKTVITGNEPTSDVAALEVITKATGGSPAGFFRVSGFTFKAMACGSSASDQAAIVMLRGLSHQVRFDHNRIESSVCGGIGVDDDVRGVADHNEIVNVACTLCHMTRIQHSRWADISSNATHDYGDGSWSEPDSWGTKEQFIFEDNTIENQLGDPDNGGGGQYLTNDWKGARTTYRFNRWINGTYQTHGTESGGRVRGFRHVEHYRQVFTWAFGSYPSQIATRGGSARAFDNAMSGNLARGVDHNVYRSVGPFAVNWPFGRCGAYAVSSITRVGTTATVSTSQDHGWQIGNGSGWAMIRGANEAGFNKASALIDVLTTKSFTYQVVDSGPTTATGTIEVASAFDGNTDSTGYPCMDQVGRGQGILIRGTEPGYSAPDPNPPTWAGNALVPNLYWNNRVNGTVSPGEDNNPVPVTQENRDFYNQNGAFDGTVGIGRGLRSARPATCTTGVYYWSTDSSANWNLSTTETYSAATGAGASGADGALDKCTATNTWTNDWYVPYTYPHPLVTGTVDNRVPGAPSNLAVQ